MTSQQLDMFSAKPLPRVDRRLAPEERQRLSQQCRLILERLERGSASNAELGEISLRYSARILELRRAGYGIEIVERERKTGRCVYALIEGEN